MRHATTSHIVTGLSVIGLLMVSAPPAVAHDPSPGKDITSARVERNVTRQNAKKLIETLLKRHYKGEGLRPHSITREGDGWKVAIKRRLKTVAFATVDVKTGNIHIENR